MKKFFTLLVFVLTFTVSTLSNAGGELKEVCKDKIAKDGKPVMKDGKAVQECKTIKVHKKLEGREVPTKK